MQRVLVLLPAALVLSIFLVHAYRHPNWGDRAETRFPPDSGLRLDTEIVYAHYGKRRMVLDLYRPATVTSRKIPAVLVIRGGGFEQGDHHGFAFIAAYLAKSGYAAACVQYRITSEARFPAAVQDVKAAARWLRANADAYGIDADRLGAIGGSAGALLAALLATTDGVADLEGEGGNQGVPSRIAAAVGMATPGDFTDMSPYPIQAHVLLGRWLGSPVDKAADARRRASPATYVTRNAAPILLVHSDADPDVPYSQAILLQRRYHEAGAHAELFTVHAAPHDPWNYARWFPDVMAHAIQFFRQAFARGE
jgi:acetyl esterase/lipase